MTVDITVELPQPQIVISERHDAAGIEARQGRKVPQLTSEQASEVMAALRTLQEIYPLLRSDFPKDRSKDYETRRSEFKPILNKLECALVVFDKHCPEEVPTFHRFTPGMYIREVHVPAGTIFTSVTHKTQHPFVLSKGVCDICNEVGDVERYHAPYTGITEPGTRRVFLVHEDMVLTTFHVTEITDPDQWLLENTAIENESLPEEYVAKCFTNKEELKWQA
jgi:hypothetical protein